VIVYCDTTPIIALSSVDRLSLLPELFGQVRVPTAVMEECAVGGPVHVPLLSAMTWIIPGADEPVAHFSSLVALDRGEKQTLAQALTYGADLVIIDERHGRRLAEYLGLKVIGTLGILVKAKSAGLIPSFRMDAERMREQGLFFHPGLIDRLASCVGET
jgi:hypothetical protein